MDPIYLRNANRENLNYGDYLFIFDDSMVKNYFSAGDSSCSLTETCEADTTSPECFEVYDRQGTNNLTILIFSILVIGKFRKICTMNVFGEKWC